MLKTQKIIIAIIAAVVIVGGIAAAVIVTNHKSTPSSDTQTRQENQQASSGAQANQENLQASSDSETDQESQQTSSDTDELVFWLHTVDWGEEKDLTGITIFNGEFTTPINLEDFNGDERFVPFYSEQTYESSNNLTDLFDSDEIIGYYSADFWTQISYDEENDTYIYYDEEYTNTTQMIRLGNYTEENMSIREAYENNRFIVQTGYADGFFQEFDPDHVNVYYSDKAFSVYDAVIDKYGRPSYIIANYPSAFYESQDTFLDTYNRNVGDIGYILVWENEDFVLMVNMSESIDNDNGTHFMKGDGYNGFLFAYVSSELWPDFKNYFSEIFQIIDLDDLR